MRQSSELRELVLRTYAAVAGGDMAFYDRHLSRREGVLIIGSDPNEWWAGSETIKRVFEAQQQETGGICVVGSDPLAYSEGNVGWVADRPSFRLPDGTHIPFRSTIVFEKEGDTWKIVHQHISIGVPNESVVGREVTVL
jgi:ketosteroid isomerase-like protein